MDLSFLARRVVERLVRLLQAFGRRFFPVEREVRAGPWRAVDGDRTLRMDYDLGPDSIVLDLGGYRGQFTSDIFARYLCTIHVFEPVPSFAAEIEARFERNPKVFVHAIALGAQDGELLLGADEDATSEFHGSAAVRTQVRRAADVLDELGIREVDLMEVNIEGGEYDLLDHLLDVDFMRHVRDLQIQFHDFVPNAQSRMERIQERLRETHELTYQYPFVWENWRRRNG